MDLNHRSPGYEPDGISRLPHLVNQRADLPSFQTTDARLSSFDGEFDSKIDEILTGC